MEYGLPTTVTVAGMEYSIRTDYRDILTICTALTDPFLDGQDRAEILLTIFYHRPGMEGPPRRSSSSSIFFTRFAT